MTRSELLVFARQNWLAVALLLFSLAVMIWFGGHLLLDLVYFNDPAHKDAVLQGWMTPRYITLSYDLPRSVVLDVLGLDEVSERGRHLADIALDKGITLDELTQRVRTAAEAHRTGRQ